MIKILNSNIFFLNMWIKSEPLLIYEFHGVVLLLVQFYLCSPNYIFLLAGDKKRIKRQNIF